MQNTIHYYPIPKRQILDPSKLNRDCKGQFQIENRKFFKRVENTVGKEENDG